MRLRLRVALWLGWRLPFRWAPYWLNGALARWMWRTPGFNDYELGAFPQPTQEPRT
jgi:hypothetical protein